MRFAFFGFPHLGGTWTVYRHLRRGLGPRGIRVEWLGIGPDAHRAAADPDWVTERADGRAAGRAEDGEAEQAAALFEAIVEQRYDGVFVNVHADRVQTNLARYLPGRVIRVLIAHNVTPGTYAAAAALRDHVHAAVGVSARVRDDLVARHGFDPARTHAVWNATDLVAGGVARGPRSDVLRLVCLGRVDDGPKGVLWLPDILRRLPDPARYRLTVAGDGPDLPLLKARLEGSRVPVAFLGGVAPEAVPGLLAAQDVLLGPSRYEGFMITLAEAMAAGVVPVASRIRGVTDEVVADGRSGLLFPVGDTKTAAALIARLGADRALLDAMAAEAIRSAGRFTVARMAEGYARVIGSVADRPPPILPPLDLARWTLPAGLRPGLRSYLPTPLKNVLRTLKERVA